MRNNCDFHWVKCGIYNSWHVVFKWLKKTHEGVSNFMLLFFCISVKTEHEQLLAPISCGKLNLNTSVPTSSKDEDSPTLAILLFMTSCFTKVPNKLLIKNTNLNTPVALAVTDIFVFVIKGVCLGIFRCASSMPIKQPSIWAGVFWADKSWQPEKQKVSKMPGRDKTQYNSLPRLHSQSLLFSVLLIKKARRMNMPACPKCKVSK